MTNRLKELRNERGWTLQEVADKLGTTHTTVSRLEGGKRGLDGEWIEKFAALYQVTQGEILEPARTVPIVGYVGAGSEVHLFEGDASTELIDEAEAPPDATEHTVAVIVAGDSMEPVFRDRDLIYYETQPGDPGDLIGRECVVRLADGRTFVKILMRGSEPGLFNLFSYNAPLISDVAVQWAVRVAWVKRHY